MGRLRELLVVGGLFLAFVLFVALGPGSAPPASASTPTTYSSEPTGALALYEWARALGYDARRLEYRPFELSDEDDALVMLSPSDPVSRARADATLAWVERGGTLILADDTSDLIGARNALFEALDVELAVISSTERLELAGSLQPAFDAPPVDAAQVRTGRALLPRRADYAALLGSGEHLVVAGVRHGRGYIYLSAAAHPFTNEGLRDDRNAALALNMLRRVPPGGRILFDEFHHGLDAPPSPADGLLSTPWGWAGVYAALVVALYLVLSGRRFGRAVPLAEETGRRSSAEYVASVADLFQRGGKRSYVLRHYAADLKRRLARPYGVSAQLDDQAFVRELARFRELDEPELLALLARLRAAPASEAELLRRVAEVDAYLAREEARR